MTWQYPYHIFILSFTAVAASLAALFIWRRRSVPGAKYLFVLMIAMMWWATVNALEFLTIEIPVKIFWTKLSYLSIPNVAPLWFLFVMRYTQHDRWLNRKRILLIWTIPMLMMALAATNEYHGLLWPKITPVSPEPGAMLSYAHGPAIWIDVIYAYTFMLIGTVQIFNATFQADYVYRRQTLLLVLAALAPWVGNILYVTDSTPFVGLDFTPFAFTITGLIFAVSIFRYQFFKLVPIAHHTLFENMDSGVLVRDTLNYLVDINPAARKLLHLEEVKIGENLDDVETEPVRELLNCGSFCEIHTTDTKSVQWLSVTASPLSLRGHPVGHLMMIQDITERKRMENEREEIIQTLQKALSQIKTLQGLIPICSHCKKIRDDQGYWRQIENFLVEHSDVVISHGVCPECMEKYYGWVNKDSSGA